ncbi:MAG: DNA polymerase III subunit chi [Legionellaceae bacterium]|nr:DNA polymerase III subunit chi [Legionellaceae bacterium]
MRIDFYVLKNEHPDALKQVVARLLEKAYQQHLRTWVVCNNIKEAETLDDWLWTYKVDSFLPHSLASNLDEGVNPPIQISVGDTMPPTENFDLLLNLNECIPAYPLTFERVLDVVAADQKVAGRTRYKQYQQLNLPIHTHHL